MTKYHKILAAVDFNEHSAVVIKSALMQAECSGAELVAVHIVDFVRPVDEDYIIPPTDKLEESLLISASKRLKDILDRFGATVIRPVITLGRPSKEILRVAEKEAADLIVIGAHGHHGILGLLGSTTDRVLHRASCHVLTVR